jgi:hypothetical protein
MGLVAVYTGLKSSIRRQCKGKEMLNNKKHGGRLEPWSAL